MNFEKPKVTIDLEEYNTLKNEIRLLKETLENDVDKEKIRVLERICGVSLSLLKEVNNNLFYKIIENIRTEFKFEQVYITKTTDSSVMFVANDSVFNTVLVLNK